MITGSTNAMIHWCFNAIRTASHRGTKVHKQKFVVGKDLVPFWGLVDSWQTKIENRINLFALLLKPHAGHG